MGDLRNKMAKQARDEAHRQHMAKRYPPAPRPEPVRCQCGFTYHDTPLWQVGRNMHCLNCMPHELRSLVIWDVANMPDGLPD